MYQKVEILKGRIKNITGKRMANRTFTMALELLVLFVLFDASLIAKNASSLEEWVPYIPSADIVELNYWRQGGVSYVNVSITFPSSGFNVSDWGTPTFGGNSVWVNAKIWMWTGATCPIIITVKHTYNLGVLPPGGYNFTFKVWDSKVKSVTFKVPPKLLLTTDKSSYKLGENVTIILANIDSETVEIGGYPAWQIYTYLEEKPVFPAIFAFLLWSLEPGENDTFVWNQYDAFNNAFCNPGTYIIKDTQGWGLSTLFRIYIDQNVFREYGALDGPFCNQFGIEFWIIQINGHPVRLISNQ
jgi:hypothetical protein